MIVKFRGVVSLHELRDCVEDFLNLRRLDEAHLYARDSLLSRETDQKTVFHRLFYARVEECLRVYRHIAHRLCKHVLGDGPFVCQKVPTFRVHLPGNVAVGEFHVDSQYGHQPEETTFWVPLTDARGTSTLWVESEPGLGDFAPVDCEYGEVVAFSGARLAHGNVLNETGRTRVSADFRCMRESEYDPEWRGKSVNSGLKLQVGEYFERVP